MIFTETEYVWKELERYPVIVIINYAEREEQ